MENLVLKPLVDTSPRIQRLMLRLTQYHMDVVYKSGKSMLVSDCLSRMANPTTCKEDESLNLQIMSIEQEQCITLSEVKKALTEDPVSILLGDLIVNGWPNTCKELENKLKPYWIHRFNLSLVDGIILLGKDRIVVPITLREKFLNVLHYTHQGITKTLGRARNNTYWPGIAHDVLKLCRECEICAEDHADPCLSMSTHSKAFGPGFKYGVDIGEIDGFPHLIIVDYYSFTIFERPLPSVSTSSVITAFKTVFSDSGVPLSLVTDNAACFTGEEFTEFAQNWNFEHITSSLRYPKGNAHAEKAVGMVKQICTRCDDLLFDMLVLKTVPISDLKESPDKLFYGRSLNTNLPKSVCVHKSYEERYINKEPSGRVPGTRNFQVNDAVWVKISEHFPWSPGTVVKVHPHDSFDVRVDDKVYRCNTHHLTRKYPREIDREERSPICEPRKELRRRPKFAMPRIPVQTTMQKGFEYK